MIYIYSQFIDKKIKFRINDIFKFDKSLAKDFLKYSSPVVCNEFFWSLGTTITVAILAQYGTSVIAANTIATTVSQMVTVFAFGVANAAAVIVGKEIGSGNIKYAKQCATTLQIISFLFGIVLLIFLFLIKGFAIDLYSLTGESAAITDSFLVALAIIMPFQFFAATGIIGTFRGGGDTKYGFFCDMITIWIYAIPISAALTFFTDVSPILVFFIIKSEEIIKSFLVLFRLKNGRWLNIVTRDQ